MNHGRLIERAAAVVAAVAALASAAPANAADGPGTGRIAFATAGGGLATIQPDGRRQASVLDSATVTSPAYSPDHRRIAFAAGALGDTRIAVVDAEGGTPQVVAASSVSLHALSSPTWSADGTQLAFAAAEGLFTVPAAGGTPAKVELAANLRDPQDPAFSPDGTRLAFSALDAESDRRIFIRRLTDGETTQFSQGGGTQSRPSWSPDGALIAYVNHPLGSAADQVAVRPVAGGAADIWFADATRPVAGRPAFSPDAKLVAFTVTAAGECAAPLLAADESGAAHAIGCAAPGAVDWAPRAPKGVTRLISALPGSDREGGNGASGGAQVTADGHKIVFTATATNLVTGLTDGDSADVFIRDDDTGRTSQVSVTASGAATNGASDLPLATRSGDKVVFRSTATNVIDGYLGGPGSLYIHNTANGLNQLVSHVDGRSTTGSGGTNRPLAITPDGHYVLWSSDGQLFRYDAFGGSNTRIGPGETGAISDDGSAVVFESTAQDLVAGFVDHNGAAPSLFRRDVAAGTTTLLDGRDGSATDSSDAAPRLEGLAGDRVLFASGDATYLRTGAQLTLVAQGTSAARLAGPDVVVERDHRVWLGATQLTDADATLVGATAGFALVRSSADLAGPDTQAPDALYRIDLATLAVEPLSGAPADGGTISDDGAVVAFDSRAAAIDGFIDGNGDAADAFAWLDRAVAERDVLKPKIEVAVPGDDALYRQGRTVLADYSCTDEGPSGLASCDGPIPSGQPLDTSHTGDFTFTVTARDKAGNTAHDTIHYRVAAANDKLKLVTHGGQPLQSANDDSRGASFSADGHYLVFESAASNLVAGEIEGNQGYDVYRRDLRSGATELVSAARGETAPRSGHGESSSGAASPDGRYVVFRSDADDLVPGYIGAGTQLYVRDMVEGTTRLVTHARSGDTSGVAGGVRDFALSADGGTIVFTSDAPSIVAGDTNGALDVFVADVATLEATLVSVRSGGPEAANGTSSTPAISADGGAVAFLSNAPNLVAGDPLGTHAYWRNLKTGETKLVDRRADDPARAASSPPDGVRLSADGRTVLFATGAGEIVDGYQGEGTQLYRRDMAAGGAAQLVSSAWNDARRGTGGTLDQAVMSADGATVAWASFSDDVVEGFVDNNEDGLVGAPDVYVRTGGAARLAVHDPLGPAQGMQGVEVYPAGLSDDGRFLAYRQTKLFCDNCGDAQDDIRRLDLRRDRSTNVVASANDAVEDATISPDGKRVAFSTLGDNLLDGFDDVNNRNNGDVYAWFDAPPVPAAISKVTGSLTLGFDASGSDDPDGDVEFFDWDFGDGRTGTGAKVTHAYADEGTFDVKLTIEDDGGNVVVHTFEVVAIKGVLTTGGAPLDFVGIDKHLRCSVVRDGPLLAAGGGACGTFVALGGRTYGPPELIDGTTDFTPVSQEFSSAGDVTTLVTTVALGDTGVRLRERDAYRAGAGFYRTDLELLSDAAVSAKVYRAAQCAIGDGTGQRSLHDAGTAMAGCDGVQAGASGARTVASWLPLSPGAEHEAGPASAVLAHIGGALSGDCACGGQDDPAAAIAWAVQVPAGGSVTRGSLAAFGPDGTTPLTLSLKADKTEVQPLDENAFTVVLRNPNAGAAPVAAIAVDGAGAWDAVPGSSSGLTTRDPAGSTWTGPFTLAGHGSGQLRFGVVHRSGQRTAVSVATAGAAAAVDSTGLDDLGTAKETVVARSISTALPNTAITSGPAGATNDRDPRFTLEASKDGVHFECRFEGAEWAPCEGNPHRPGPLADGPYTLEARAVDAVGADDTPARRTFVVDVAAPNTAIVTAPKPVISDPRPVISFSASEPAHYECSMAGPGRSAEWFACETPYRPGGLADGEWTFSVRAIDAAGNVDTTPAVTKFRLDTTPPVTVLDALSAKVLGATSAAQPTAAGAGSTLAVGGDGAAAVQVACPVTATAPCEGTVGLATEPVTAGAARLAALAPDNAVPLARAPFRAQPGQSVAVRLKLAVATRNTLERAGRMAAFTTLDLGSGRPLRGSDVILTPDPRTVRLLDAGLEVKVRGGAISVRLAGSGRGSIAIAGHRAPFTIHRRGRVRVRLGKDATPGRTLSVVLKTRRPGTTLAKRLTLTLGAQEARR